MPNTTSRPVRVFDLRVLRGERTVLHSIDACFAAGEVTAVAGPNGSGKSTLLEAIAGVLPLAAGRIHGLPDRGVAFVPQRSAVSSQLPLTVIDTVIMGRWRTLGAWRRVGATDRRVVEDVLRTLGLERIRDRPLHELSGGQRQRALVAQGLASQAPVLLLDEPTAGVDAESAAAIDAALRSCADAGAVVILATHDPAAVASADAAIRLKDGHVSAPRSREDTPRLA